MAVDEDESERCCYLEFLCSFVIRGGLLWCKRRLVVVRLREETKRRFALSLNFCLSQTLICEQTMMTEVRVLINGKN